MKQLLAATLLSTTAVVASAQTLPPPAGVLSLSAEAVTEVPTDVVQLTLAAEQEGAEPSAISSALSARTQAVLAQAKRTSGVEAQSGGFTIHPSTDRNGRISTWRGRSEVILKSKDFAAVSKLAGELANQMQVQNVAFSLSREARQATEAKLAEQAVSAFRDKAQTSTKLFGYSNYTIREVSMNDSGGVVPPTPRMYAAKAMSADAGAPIPMEGGKAHVTVSVNGSVQMVK
ncbi:Predicted secreted protein [Cupriavidus sp. OV038]|jgi:predicted secreted protein|uniref:SIMPL domain-containing protein n=1 Tax=unclassified Cupriavidus TaxID=2640874 RepID=UPI0008E00E06|nr:MULTISPECIES: SIMPL domain-containing protein [unclassified Cupriavidus]SFB80630.1 Predicted secreted protein [Cupriavidus sp. OV038]SFO66610.1 Predicted secreted protein [Cupriavidus sp. OV096]